MCSRTNSCRNLVFLSGDLVLQVKLLRFQLVHPLPQLFGFLSVREHQSDNVVLPVLSALSGSFHHLSLPPSTYLSRSWFKLSTSSDLRLSLRIFFFFSRSVCLLPLRFSVCGRVEGIRTCVLDPRIEMQRTARRTHQLLHVPSKMEAREGFLFLGVIFGSPFGFLLFLTSSLILS